MRRGHEVIVTIDVSLYISAPSNVAENALFICTRIYGHCRFVTLSRKEERVTEGRWKGGGRDDGRHERMSRT